MASPRFGSGSACVGTLCPGAGEPSPIADAERPAQYEVLRPLACDYDGDAASENALLPVVDAGRDCLQVEDLKSDGIIVRSRRLHACFAWVAAGALLVAAALTVALRPRTGSAYLEDVAGGDILQTYAALDQHIRLAVANYCADVHEATLTMQLWPCRVKYYTQTFSWISGSGNAGKISWIGPWAKARSTVPLCVAPESIRNGSPLVIVHCAAAPFFELAPGKHGGKHIRLQHVPSMCIAGTHWRPVAAEALHLWKCLGPPEQQFVVPSTWSSGLKDGTYWASPVGDSDKFLFLNSFQVPNGGKAFVQIFKDPKIASSQWTVNLLSTGGGTTILLESRDQPHLYVGVDGDAVRLVDGPTHPGASWGAVQVTSAVGAGDTKQDMHYRLKSAVNGRYLAVSEDLTSVALHPHNADLGATTIWEFRSIPSDELAQPSPTTVNPRMFPMSVHIKALEAKLIA